MLYQQNLQDFFQQFAGRDGYEILVTPAFTAMKTPAKMTGVNFVWGAVTPETVQTVATFFQDFPYGWMVPEEAAADREALQKQGFVSYGAFPEMHLNLKNYQPRPIAPEISIIPVSELDPWCTIANQAFEGLLSLEGIQDTQRPILKTSNCRLFLGHYEGQPAATGLVHLNRDSAGIYFMGVTEPFRRKGLGTAITQACLDFAKDKVPTACLQASTEAIPLYQRLGFKVMRYFEELSPPVGPA